MGLSGLYINRDATRISGLGPFSFVARSMQWPIRKADNQLRQKTWVKQMHT